MQKEGGGIHLHIFLPLQTALSFFLFVSRSLSPQVIAMDSYHDSRLFSSSLPPHPWLCPQ